MASRAAVPPSGATVSPLPPMERRILRCRERHIEAASKLLGLDLPQAAYGSASREDLHALWLGPDEWLILAAALPSIAADAWAEIGASFVDISHRQVAIALSGAASEACLASGCPLDLAMKAFPVGACTRTLYHKAEIIVWRTAADRFHIEVWRSFAPYVQALLNEAG